MKVMIDFLTDYYYNSYCSEERFVMCWIPNVQDIKEKDGKEKKRE